MKAWETEPLSEHPNTQSELTRGTFEVASAIRQLTYRLMEVRPLIISTCLFLILASFMIIVGIIYAIVQTEIVTRSLLQ